MFNVDMLKTYWDPNHVNMEALAPGKAAVLQAASFGSRHPISPPFEAAAVPANADVST